MNNIKQVIGKSPVFKSFNTHLNSAVVYLSIIN